MKHRTEYSLHAHDKGYYQVEDMSKRITMTEGVVVYKGSKLGCENFINSKLKGSK